jgi:hypothetical protein
VSKLKDLNRVCSDIAYDTQEKIQRIKIDHMRYINDLRMEKERFRLDHDVIGMVKCDERMKRANDELEPRIEAAKDNGKKLIGRHVELYQESLSLVNLYESLDK